MSLAWTPERSRTGTHGLVISHGTLAEVFHPIAEEIPDTKLKWISDARAETRTKAMDESGESERRSELPKQNRNEVLEVGRRPNFGGSVA